MLRIRFVCVAAATLSIASVATASGANAQSASTDSSNTPSLLTQLFSQATAGPAPASTASAPASTVAPPVKTARSGRATSRKHRTYAKQAAHQHGDPSADTPQNNASADAWLAASAPPNATPTNSVPASPSASADPAQQDSAPSASGALPNTVMVGGQTVRIAQVDQVNDIDLAASSAPANAPAVSAQPAINVLAANAPGEATRHATMGPTVQSTMESTLPRSDRADLIGAAAVKTAQADAALTASAAAPPNGGEAIDPGPADSAAPDSGAQSINDQNSAVQDSSTQDSGMIGGAAWIAQVLAALGGALTAGIVAWVLIGAEPVRHYS